jgi:hypothetical protein
MEVVQMQPEQLVGGPPRRSALPAFDSSPEAEARAAKVARSLRAAGYSFEDIAEGHMVRADGSHPELAQVYGWCHPEKSAEQVAAWRRKHGRSDR